MKIFLDTSSLIKLYVNEKGTSDIDKIFTNNVITEIFVSGVTKIEFHSAIYKKLRTKDLSSQNAEVILKAFVVVEQNFKFILIDSDIINTSQMFVKKYGAAGLRTLDAIQLASAYSFEI